MVFDVLSRFIKMHISLTINYIIGFNCNPDDMILAAVCFYAVQSFNFLFFLIKINIIHIQFNNLQFYHFNLVNPRNGAYNSIVSRYCKLYWRRRKKYDLFAQQSRPQNFIDRAYRTILKKNKLRQKDRIHHNMLITVYKI